MRSLTLNGSVPTWPKCLGCALSDRAMGYTSENRSSDCASCFQTWCWNGEDNDAAPSGEYEPTVGSVPSFLSQNNLVSGQDTSATSAITPSGSASPSSGSSGAGLALAMPGVALGGVVAAVSMLVGAGMMW